MYFVLLVSQYTSLEVYLKMCIFMLFLFQFPPPPSFSVFLYIYVVHVRVSVAALSASVSALSVPRCPRCPCPCFSNNLNEIDSKFVFHELCSEKQNILCFASAICGILVIDEQTHTQTRNVLLKLLPLPQILHYAHIF